MAAPYSYSRLQTYLTTLQRRHPEYVSLEKIGSSVQDRRVDLVTIGNTCETENINNDNKKRVVVVIARTHPGESPSSYVCQGLLELMSSEHQIAQTLREHVIFKVVPMLNPDGVFLGNYRSTLMGFDLNRSWNTASPWAHPTLTAIIKMLKALDSHELYQLDFVVDIHAHSSLTGAFIYGNTYEDIYRYERHIVFPKLLASNADDYITEHSMFNADMAKAGTARRHICTMFADRVNSYTLEVSLYAYKVAKGEGSTLVPYNEEAYMRLGRNFTRTFIDYYKVIGVIVSGPSRELSPRGRRPLTHRSKRRKSRSAFLQRPRTTQRYSAFVKHMDLTNCDPLSDEECEFQYYPNSFFTKHSRSLFEGDSSFSHLFRYKAGLPTPNQDSGYVTSSSTNIKQVGGGGFVGQGSQRQGSPIPQVFTVPQTPSLSIIDFNQLTRGSLEAAIERSRKVDGRSARSYK